MDAFFKIIYLVGCISNKVCPPVNILEVFSWRRTLFFGLFEAEWRFGRLSVGAVLVGTVGVDGTVWLLPVLAGGHPLVYPVQAARLLEVANLPRGRETLNGCRKEEKAAVSRRNGSVSLVTAGDEHTCTPTGTPLHAFKHHHATTRRHLTDSTLTVTPPDIQG